MELNNDFEVDAPIDQAWTILTDVERIAPCLPGAQLQEVEGDEYRGIVKVKVGPITAQYKGKAVFVEKDDANKKAVLKADGRDTRGAGNASALITAQLEPLGDRTKVTVNTDLTVTGKVAQFGRGVMADVSAKLMGQFADNLGALLERGGEPAAEPAAAEPVAAAEPAAAAAATPDVGSGAAPASETLEADKGEVGSTAGGGDVGGSDDTGASTRPESKVRRIDSPEPVPVDLLDTAGAPVAKRVLPVVGVLALLLVVWRLVRGRK